MIICPFCRSSKTILKGQKEITESFNGKPREYAEQTYYCRECCKNFTVKMV